MFLFGPFFPFFHIMILTTETFSMLENWRALSSRFVRMFQTYLYIVIILSSGHGHVSLEVVSGVPSITMVTKPSCLGRQAHFSTGLKEKKARNQIVKHVQLECVEQLASTLGAPSKQNSQGSRMRSRRITSSMGYVSKTLPWSLSASQIQPVTCSAPMPIGFSLARLYFSAFVGLQLRTYEKILFLVARVTMPQMDRSERAGTLSNMDFGTTD